MKSSKLSQIEKKSATLSNPGHARICFLYHFYHLYQQIINGCHYRNKEILYCKIIYEIINSVGILTSLASILFNRWDATFFVCCQNLVQVISFWLWQNIEGDFNLFKMIIAERKQLLCSGGKYLFGFDYSKTMGYA